VIGNGEDSLLFESAVFAPEGEGLVAKQSKANARLGSERLIGGWGTGRRCVVDYGDWTIGCDLLGELYALYRQHLYETGRATVVTRRLLGSREIWQTSMRHICV